MPLTKALLPTSLALALTALACLAGPVDARVEDPLELLGPGVAGALEQELSNLHADDIDVFVTTRAPGGAAAEAAQAFVQRKRGPASGLILVAVQDEAVGVALGESYRARGVTPERVAQLVENHVPPAFHIGVPSDGVIAVVREIKLARTLGPRPGYVPPPPPPRIPWELLVGAALALTGGAAWALVRRGRRRHRLGLAERVRGERGRLAKLREDLRLLAERLAAPGEDAAAGALARAGDAQRQALEGEQAEVRAGLRALSDRLDAGDAAGVPAALAALAQRAAVLQMGVATLTAACAPLAAEPAGVARAIAEAEGRLAALADRQLAADPLVTASLAEARACAAAGAPVAALEQLARACAVAAPADPDEAWLALMSAPSEGPGRAADLVARWERLREAVEAEEARDREAGRRGSGGGRARLDELEAMLRAPLPDLVRAGQLLDATERLADLRRAPAAPGGSAQAGDA